MKTVLITGATSGLGLMLSRHYNKIGFNLITIGKNKKKINLLKKELSEKNKKHSFSLDLNIKKNYQYLLKIINKQKKNIDIIIHCLGGGFGLHNPTISQKELKYLFNLNVLVAVGINNNILRLTGACNWLLTDGEGLFNL